MNRSSSAVQVRGAWLQAETTQAVFAALSARGHVCRAVGGTVRNALLGLPVTDIDIATDAPPDKVMQLATRAGLKTVPTGLKHGTVTVIAGGVPHEVTTLRRDVETDGRHATVAFTDDWAADAGRRDFTINAIYCNADGTIFDPLRGMADLKPIRIRFIGEATTRIREDYLRILRFFRFTATLSADGMLDPAGLAASATERDGLSRISGERIGAEFLKLLVGPHAVPVVRAMATSVVLAAATGLDGRPEDVARLAAIEDELGASPDAILRLAALFVHDAASARTVAARLKLSAADRDRLAATVEAMSHRIDADLSAGSARALRYGLGAQAYRDAVRLAWARSGVNDGEATNADKDANEPAQKAWRQLATLDDVWTVPTLPVSGADILSLGVPAGPAVGAILRTVDQAFIASDFRIGRDGLLAQAAKLAASRRA